MKRIFVLCLMITVLFTIAGCKKTAPDPVPQPAPLEITHGDPIDNSEGDTSTPIHFGVQYIRTNGYQDGAKFPKVEIITSKENLNTYYTTYQDIYNLERRETVYSDTSIGFLDACDKYDDTFFQENYLIFVLLEEGSGSVSHKVEQIGLNNDKTIRVDIHREVPEAGTADMAEWHIILELSQENLVDSPNDVQVYLDGKLAFDGVPVEMPYTEPEPIFKSPPNGWISTPEGEYKLTRGGCNWTHQQDDGEYISIIADQAGRPIDQRFLETVNIDSKFLETVYAPIPGSTAYEPTNSLGCLLKLDFEARPTSVTFTCWPDTVWQDSSTPEEDLISQEGFAFYAKPGRYVYEIIAEWEQGNSGYFGTANYYICINVEVGS